MRQLRFTVQAALGSTIVAHASAETLDKTLDLFRSELADNESDWSQLVTQAKQAQEVRA